MKKYLISIIFALISLSCFAIYNLTEPYVNANGVIVEPFYLLPLGYICVIIAIIYFFVTKNIIKTNFSKKSNKNQI